jgi:hypothetical protein
MQWLVDTSHVRSNRSFVMMSSVTDKEDTPGMSFLRHLFSRGARSVSGQGGTVETSGWPQPEIKPGVTYLYILQKSSAPSDYVLNQVLAFWKGKRGSNFAMLGGMRATSIPETADMYVMGILFAICDRYGFARQPDKLGYSTLKAGGEKVGVCRFIN